MKLISIMVAALMSSCSIHRMAGPNDVGSVSSAKRLLLTNRIPQLLLEDATFDESMKIVEGHWENTFPEKSFPFASVNYRIVDENRAEKSTAISLDLKDVTYAEALYYIAKMSGRRYKDIGDLSVAEEIVWIEEDWGTQVFEVDDRVLTFLGIKKGMKPAEVEKKINLFGIILPYGAPVLSSDGKMLIVRNTEEEHMKLAGIIHLIKQGYTIQKAK